MTVRIAGHWEIGYSTPIVEAHYWNLPLRDFEVWDWWMHPVSGITPNEGRVKLHERKCLQDILDENTDVQHVYVEPYHAQRSFQGVVLKDFEHPKDVLYIFGSAHFSPPVQHMRDIDLGVTIETVQNKGVLWAFQAMPIILYDRLMK